MREQVIERIRAKKIITIVRGVYGEQVAHLAEALAAGGIELMEVTFDQSDTAAHAQTAAAIHAIKAHMGERMLDVYKRQVPYLRSLKITRRNRA